MPIGSLALYTENKVLEHVVGKADFESQIGDVFVGLFTVAPTHENGTGGTECTGVGNYARKVTAAVDWNAAAAGAISNANDITFIECAAANWGEINGFALFDALADGNMLAWGNITTPKDINIGDTAKLAAGDIAIALD